MLKLNNPNFLLLCGLHNDLYNNKKTSFEMIENDKFTRRSEISFQSTFAPTKTGASYTLARFIKSIINLTIITMPLYDCVTPT